MNNFGFDINEAIDLTKEKEEMKDFTDIELNHKDQNKDSNISSNSNQKISNKANVSSN